MMPNAVQIQVNGSKNRRPCLWADSAVAWPKTLSKVTSQTVLRFLWCGVVWCGEVVLAQLRVSVVVLPSHLRLHPREHLVGRRSVWGAAGALISYSLFIACSRAVSLHPWALAAEVLVIQHSSITDFILVERSTAIELMLACSVT